jgi:hypothetical protein
VAVCVQEGQGRGVSGGGGGGELGIRQVAAAVADDRDVDGVGMGGPSLPEVGTGRVAQTGHY